MYETELHTYESFFVPKLDKFLPVITMSYGTLFSVETVFLLFCPWLRNQTMTNQMELVLFLMHTIQSGYDDTLKDFCINSLHV